MRTLVVGLGNPLLTDDRVGLLVARRLRTRLEDRSDVDVVEDCNGGLRLMERMVGYDKAIVVDAMQTGGPAGTVRRLSPPEVPTRHSASAHDASLTTALAFGRAVGAPLPADADVVVVGIEASDVTSFGTRCTPAIRAAIPIAVETVVTVVTIATMTDLPNPEEP